MTFVSENPPTRQKSNQSTTSMLSESSTIRDEPPELVELRNSVERVANRMQSDTSANLETQLRDAKAKVRSLVLELKNEAASSYNVTLGLQQSNRELIYEKEALTKKIEALAWENEALAEENEALAQETSRLKGVNQGLGNSDKTLEQLRELLLK